MRLIHADLSRLANQSDYRYALRPRAWSDADWQKYRPGLVGHLNQISKQAIPYPSGSAGIVPVGNVALRIDVRRLGYREAWDRLHDPYLSSGAHEQLYEAPAASEQSVKVKKSVTHPGGDYVYPPGAFVRRDDTGEFVSMDGKVSRNVAPGEYFFWVDEAKAVGKKTIVGKRRVAGTGPAVILMDGPEDEKLVNQIYQWTGSKAALVRADWLDNQILASENRDPGYNDFLGFKTQDEFHKLGGFDKKLAQGFRFEIRDAINGSGVAVSKVRGIVRFDTAGGALWQTQDFKNPHGEAHPLRAVGRDTDKLPDASEEYITLANGLWGLGAFDNKGVFQRIVPQTIALDGQSRSTDKNIHTAVSCIRCHGKSGLQPLKGWFRQTLFVPPNKLNVTDYLKKGYSPEEREKLEDELEQQYKQELQGRLEDDKLRYERAVLTVTGIDSEKYAKLTSELWSRYEDAAVDLKYAAAEFGQTPEEFRGRIIAAVKASQLKGEYEGGFHPVDPLFGALVNGDSLGIRDWESIAGEGWEIARAKKNGKE